MATDPGHFSDEESTRSVNKRPDRERRARQADRMARILGVLRLIQSRGRWNAAGIAAELGCTVRTVYRDLQTLEFAGVPWYYDNVEQCYRVRSDFRFPVPNLTDEELLGQAVATAVTRAPGLNVSGGSAATTRKLAAASGETARQLLADAERVIAVLDLKLADHTKHQEIIRTIQTALIQRKQVTGRYETPYQASAVTLRLTPLRLCLVKSAWYLIGRPTDSLEPKTYRVARFKTLRMLDEPARVPDDFDLQAYFGNAWAVYRGTPTYDVEIWFAPDAARVVAETVWHHTQVAKAEADGSVRLSFRVDGLEEISHWLVAWAGHCKVLQPTELRAMFIEQLRLGLSMQGDTAEQ